MRLANWQDRMTAVLRDWRKKEFSFENNCAFFVGDCVEAVTGVDPVSDLRGNIRTARDWHKSLKEQGGFMAAVNARLGEGMHPEAARAGDIMLHESGETLGVNIGGRAVFLTDKGWTVEPLSECRKAWSIG